MAKSKKYSKGNNKVDSRGMRRDDRDDAGTARDISTSRADNSRGRNARGDKGRASASGNHISWYVSSPQQLRDVASLPFSDALMGRHNIGNRHTFIPGVARIGITPTIGSTISENNYTDASSDAINVAARGLYSYIRKANSGAKNYDPSDLMMYVMAVDSAYMMVEWARRVYGTACMFNYKNKYAPVALLTAMGVANVDALIANLAQFRATLNNNILKLAQLAVPRVLPIYNRHQYLFQNILIDRVGPKAQFYVFTPHCFYKYNETDGPGKLEKRFASSANRVKMGWLGDDPVQDLQDIFDDCLDHLIRSEDIFVMSGDILKAYGEGNIWNIPLVEELYTTPLAFDKDILNQIHNCNILPISGIGDIEQDVTTGTIYQQVRYEFGTTSANRVIASSKLFDVDSPDPTPEDVIYGSRLTILPRQTLTGTVSTGLKDNLIHATEVVTTMDIFQDAFDTKRVAPFEEILNLDEIIANGDTDEAYENITRILQVTKFDYHPFATVNCDTQEDNLDILVGDISNFTTLSASTLYNIHQATVATAFGLPYALRG